MFLCAGVPLQVEPPAANSRLLLQHPANPVQFSLYSRHVGIVLHANWHFHEVLTASIQLDSLLHLASTVVRQANLDEIT